MPRAGKPFLVSLFTKIVDKTTYLVYTALSEKANYSEITVGRNRNGQKR